MTLSAVVLQGGVLAFCAPIVSQNRTAISNQTGPSAITNGSSIGTGGAPSPTAAFTGGACMPVANSLLFTLATVISISPVLLPP